MTFQYVPIGAVFDIKNGATPSSGNEEYWDGDVAWVTPADLGKLGSRYIESGQRNISTSGYASCGTQMVRPGAIILSIRAPIGHMAIATQPLCFNQGCRGLEPRGPIISEYAFWALNAARPELEASGQGTTFIELARSKLRAVKIPLPDHETQRAIANFLDRETARIDQLVEKKQALVDRLPEKEKAKISALVLRGVDGDAPLRDSGVDWRGQVPAHWEESRLKAHFRPAKRQGYDDLEVLSVYREFGVIEKASRDDNINKTPDDLSKYQLVEPGDLVINKMKAWQGSLGVSTFRGITSPDYVVMTRTGDHHPLYMHHLLRAQPMPTVYHLISNGIRTDQWRLEPEKFRMLPVFLPPRPEQEAIAGLVEKELGKLREVSEVILRSIDRLREYRAALITAAVTGQIDISEHTRKGDTDRRLDAIEAEMRA